MLSEYNVCVEERDIAAEYWRRGSSWATSPADGDASRCIITGDAVDAPLKMGQLLPVFAVAARPGGRRPANMEGGQPLLLKKNPAQQRRG